MQSAIPFVLRIHLSKAQSATVSSVDVDVIQPKLVISVMMITTFVFEQMSLRFEGAMGFHCNRKTERQMTKRTISLSQMSRAKRA